MFTDSTVLFNNFVLQANNISLPVVSTYFIQHYTTTGRHLLLTIHSGQCQSYQLQTERYSRKDILLLETSRKLGFLIQMVPYRTGYELVLEGVDTTLCAGILLAASQLSQDTYLQSSLTCHTAKRIHNTFYHGQLTLQNYKC